MIFGCLWSVQSYHSYFELQRTMSKPASNQRWWSWQRRLSLLESLSLESFAVQFADVWISLASGLPALPSPRATIACDKAATSCAGQCSGNGICESEATALLHFELPDITRPAACATWSLGDPQLIHSWSTVDSLEVQYVHQLLSFRSGKCRCNEGFYGKALGSFKIFCFQAGSIVCVRVLLLFSASWILSLHRGNLDPLHYCISNLKRYVLYGDSRHGRAKSPSRSLIQTAWTRRKDKRHAIHLYLNISK
jgi:hypothetical protein